LSTASFGCVRKGMHMGLMGMGQLLEGPISLFQMIDWTQRYWWTT